MQYRRPIGFTLVELLIVLSILGMLAALVIPRFQSNADAVRDTSATVQLRNMRKALQLWQTEHGTNFPTLSQVQLGDEGWAVFLKRTDMDGTLDVAGEYGPYIPKPPRNPLTQSSDVADLNAATGNDGWTYDESTGELRLVVPASTNLSDLGLTENDVERLSP